MSPRRPALLERLDKGAQGRHESLEEEINFYKLSEVTASNTTNYYIAVKFHISTTTDLHMIISRGD